MTLSHDRYGSGPPLVLIHGLGHDRSAWWPVRDLLVEHRDVIALDLPGHGASAPLPAGERYDVAAYAAAVRELVDSLGLDRPQVAGNSLGGGIALELAAGGYARSATAFSPIGFASPGEARFAVASIRAARRLARMLRPVTPALLATAATRAMFLAQFYGHPGRLDVATARAAVHAFRTATAVLPTLPGARDYRFEGDPQVPVTVALGTRDRLLLPRQANRARVRLPNANHVWLRGCGHVPMADDPPLTARLMLDVDAG